MNLHQEEYSQSIARVVIAVTAMFFVTAMVFVDQVDSRTVVFLGGCVFFSLAWFMLIKYQSGDFLWRRRLISVFDILAISYSMHIAEQWGAIFYFLYLWVIVGNGMRFGVRSLVEVMIVGVVAFAVVQLNTDYWQRNLPTGVGLWLGLIILPAFYLVLIRRLHELNRKLNIELDKTTYAATHDTMTGLVNWEYFHQRIAEKVAEAERYDRKFSIVFVDLDGFKLVNDTFGHHYGDELLKIIAQRMLKLARKSDIVARLGGDEFALILNCMGSSKNVGLFAERLVSLINEPILIEGSELHVTASVGVSLYPIHGLDAKTLLKVADSAMYQAKNSGKNRFTMMDVIGL